MEAKEMSKHTETANGSVSRSPALSGIKASKS